MIFHFFTDTIDNYHQNVERIVPYDGYDMMSGGNHFAVSHFAAASKW